jgi:hypothetical protein
MGYTSKAAAKFVQRKIKCVTKCMSSFWDGVVPESDCLPPYGGRTAFCIGDPLKGVEAKTILAMEKYCSVAFGRDCPECYSGGDCSATGDPAARVASLESDVDVLIPDLFCERAGAFNLEKRCQRTAAKGIAKGFAANQRCYYKCVYNAWKLGTPAADCMPGGSDPILTTCLAAYAESVEDYIDHDCGPPPASPDACPTPYPLGAAWAATSFAFSDSTIPSTFCASPSGAFIDR